MRRHPQRRHGLRGWAFLLLGMTLALHAQVPALLNYQGRVGVGGAVFDGTGQFKFALVNADGSAVYWRNAVDADANGEPDAAVTVPVTKGLFNVILGDTTLPNMAGLPTATFNNSAVYLRAWFNDGSSGFQRLLPDQRIVAVGYSLMAAAVADGTVTMAKLGSDVVNAISTAGANTLWSPSQIPGLDASKIVSGILDPARLPGAFATLAQLAALQSQIESLSNQVLSLSTSIPATVPPGSLAASANPADAALVGLGYRASGTLAAPNWITAASAGAPSPRYDHSAVWTGGSLLIWGGNLGAGLVSGGGAAYRPDVDQWSAISPISAPEGRSGHATIWTGTEMIVWGGFAAAGYLTSGARYHPATGSWGPMSSTGAPAGRIGAVAAWTGSRLVVWGGRNASGLLGDGALFNPATDAWTPLTLPNAPAPRQNASAVWTGSKLLVWGGEGIGDALNSGAELVCGVDGVPTEWRAIATTAAPAPRFGHAAVWTGQRMLVWGGQRAGAFAGDGSSYDPATGSWQALTPAGAPSARSFPAAVWTGSEMVVVGGDTAAGATASGGAYDPATSQWRTLSNGGSPVARSGASGLWSGNQLIVFGGRAAGIPLAACQLVSPQPALHLFRKP